MEKFSCIFTDDKNIVIPKVYREFTDCRDDVIVMDYIECIDAAQILPSQRESCCRLVSDFNLKSIFEHGMFHCDMHSGNIKYTYSHNIPKLVVLDFGIVGYLTKTQFESMHRLITATSKQNSLQNIVQCIASDFVYSDQKIPNTPVNSYEPIQIFDDNILENELHFCDELIAYLRSVNPNILNLKDYTIITNILSTHGFKIRSCFSRLYLSLIITHAFCLTALLSLIHI